MIYCRGLNCFSRSNPPPHWRTWALAWVLWLAAPTAAAYDTAWHYYVTEATAKELRFSAYSTEVLHVGTWGPDYYQVFQVLISRYLNNLRNGAEYSLIPGVRRWLAEVAEGSESDQGKVRRQSIFLHFDNIQQQLDSNLRFRQLFEALRTNTTRFILQTYNDPALPEARKQRLLLFALGTSLHMLQDFYAHTNWGDLDFQNLPVGKRYLPKRLPTFFEALRFYGSDADGSPRFPFLVESGSYDLETPHGERESHRHNLPLSQQGIPLGHDYLAHDNRSMSHDGVSVAHYHRSGPLPGANAPSQHQQLTVMTALAASNEWVRLLQKDKTVAMAVSFAGKARQPRLLFNSDAGSLVQGMIRGSCLVDKWDGADPQGRSQEQCRHHKLSLSGLMLSLLHGNRELLPAPANEFWQLYREADVLGRLGSGDPDSGRYIFD